MNHHRQAKVVYGEEIFTAPVVNRFAHRKTTRYSGRSGVARMLLGSVADKIARGAGVPVLLRRPAAELSDEQQ